MLPDKLYELPQEFLFKELRKLNIDLGDFMYLLLNDRPKEIMIYVRIYVQYNLNKDQGNYRMNKR